MPVLCLNVPYPSRICVCAFVHAARIPSYVFPNQYPRDAHALLQTAQRDVHVLVVVGDVKVAEAQMIERLGLRDVGPCIDTALPGCLSECRNVQVVADARIKAEAQTLRKSVLLAVEHVLLCRPDGGVLPSS